MGDYLACFEVHPGSFKRTKIVVKSCSFEIFAEPVKSEEITKPSPPLENIHFSVIKEIESSSPERLTFTTCDNKVKNFVALEGCDEDIIRLVKLVVRALAAVFPMVPLEKLFTRLDLHPDERFKYLQDEHCAAVKAANYAADDSQEAGCLTVEQTFSLSDFHMRCSVENVELLSALQHNTWFNYLHADGTKVSSNEVRYIGNILRTNDTLQGIDLSNTGLSPESLQEIAFALTVNSASNIVDINLSHNQLGEQGISTLSAALLNLPRGLRRLNLEKTGMTTKIASKHLFNALFSNSQHASTLQCLELGGFAKASRRKSQQPAEVDNILIFLAIPNSLQELDMTDGGMDLIKAIGSLQRGCLLNMKVLNLSGNVYTANDSDDPPEHWKRFFMNASSLRTICLSRTMLSHRAFRHMLIGLSHNEKIEQSSDGISLDVSHNYLGKQGADTLTAVAPDLKNIHFLDVTNTSLERELTRVFESLQHNKSIRHLSIGQNFSFARQRPRDEALYALKALMQSEQSVLESVDVSNSNLGIDTLKILEALENSTKIKRIDLRGNNMGDIGAAQLAKILHMNTAVTWLSFDCNNITAKGLTAIAKVLRRSAVCREVPMPTVDIARAMKKDSLKTNKIMDTFLMSTFIHCQPQRPDSYSRLRRHSENAQSLLQKEQHRSSMEGAYARGLKESPRGEIDRAQASLDPSESSLDVEVTAQSGHRSVNRMPRQAFLSEEDTSQARRSGEQEVSDGLSQLDISGSAAAAMAEDDDNSNDLLPSRSTTSIITMQDAQGENVCTSHHSYLQEDDDVPTGSS